MSILVATDFSPCSAGAVRLATSLARRRGVPLLIVHAVEPPLRFADAALPIALGGWEANLIIAAEEALAREVASIRWAEISVETRVLMGDAAKNILDVASAGDVDVIVVGTHGRRGGAHLFLGSVAETVVRFSTCPVLVARNTPTNDSAWSGRMPLRLTVATDGSGASRSALTWAGQFAKGGSCDLSLVRFYFPTEEGLRYGLDEPWDGPRRDAEVLSLVERDLRRDAHAILGEVPEQLRFRATEHESSEALKEETAALGADAVVIGVPRHRWRGWTAFSVGPILRSSRLPVICVPEAARAAGSTPTPVRSILVATDLSDSSAEVLAPAYGLLQAQGGHIELCTVHEVGNPTLLAQLPLAPPLEDAERAALEARLRALVPLDGTAGITTHVSVVEGGTAAEAIVATAERLDVDLIAVGSHGRSGFKRAVLGSVAEEIARTSTRPVLLIRVRGHGTRS